MKKGEVFTAVFIWKTKKAYQKARNEIQKNEVHQA